MEYNAVLSVEKATDDSEEHVAFVFSKQSSACFMLVSCLAYSSTPEDGSDMFL
jgi:hypothetical protein